jgi:hypothetical protein
MQGYYSGNFRGLKSKNGILLLKVLITTLVTLAQADNSHKTEAISVLLKCFALLFPVIQNQFSLRFSGTEKARKDTFSKCYKSEAARPQFLLGFL